MKALRKSQCSNKRRIMIIDDESHVGLFIEILLTSRGYEVTFCNDSHDALKLFSANPDAFGLIVTDLNMPKMSGMELARNLLEIRPELPIILCTGFNYEEIENSADKLGIVAYLSKPLQPKKLLHEIQQYICTEETDNQIKQ